MKTLMPMLRKLWGGLGSLKLTVVLLALMTLMIFVATLDQARHGLLHAQTNYIEAWIGQPVPVPGGYLIGVLAILNMAAAYKKFFRSKNFSVGMCLIHTGVLLLLISGFVAGWTRSEGQLWIREGQKSNIVETTTESELVLIEKTAEGQTEWIVPFGQLKQGQAVRGWPMPAQVLYLLENTQIGPRDKNAALVANPDALVVSPRGRILWSRSRLESPQGYLKDSDWLVFQQEKNYSDTRVNAATALVRIQGVGDYLVSNLLGVEQFMPQIVPGPDGKSYEIALRLKRRVLPFDVYLKDFTFERYLGTDIPKNFSSSVTVWQDGAPKREAVIWMNNPLRYGGYTFYQASFDNKTEEATMLMVVQDDWSALPYVAVAMVTLGLLWQFSIRFFSLRRRSA